MGRVPRNAGLPRQVLAVPRPLRGDHGGTNPARLSRRVRLRQIQVSGEEPTVRADGAFDDAPASSDACPELHRARQAEHDRIVLGNRPARNLLGVRGVPADTDVQVDPGFGFGGCAAGRGESVQNPASRRDPTGQGRDRVAGDPELHRHVEHGGAAAGLSKRPAEISAVDLPVPDQKRRSEPGVRVRHPRHAPRAPVVPALQGRAHDRDRELGIEMRWAA